MGGTGLHKMTKDEMNCSECDGVGYILEDECPKCFGTGKLDWIENVVGKRGYPLSSFWDTVDVCTRTMAENFIKRIKSADIRKKRIYVDGKFGD